jgi:hypothetical protein
VVVVVEGGFCLCRPKLLVKTRMVEARFSIGATVTHIDRLVHYTNSQLCIDVYQIRVDCPDITLDSWALCDFWLAPSIFIGVLRPSEKVVEHFRLLHSAALSEQCSRLFVNRNVSVCFV